MAQRIAHQYFGPSASDQRAKSDSLTRTHFQPCPWLMNPANIGARKLLPARKNP